MWSSVELLHIANVEQFVIDPHDKFAPHDKLAPNYEHFCHQCQCQCQCHVVQKCLSYGAMLLHMTSKSCHVEPHCSTGFFAPQTLSAAFVTNVIYG